MECEKMKLQAESGDSKERNHQESDANTISRRAALKGSAVALGACYLAPATMNLLLADRAAAQVGSGPPESETYNSELRVCNYLTTSSDEVHVEFIDMFGPGEDWIPGGQEPGLSTSRMYADLLDGGEVTMSADPAAYFIEVVPSDSQSLENFMIAGNVKGAQSLINAIVQSDSYEKVTSLTFTLDNSKKCIVVSYDSPSS